VLALLPAASVGCVVTSPPYWALRSYPVSAEVFGGDRLCAHEWIASVVPGGSGDSSSGRRDRRAGRQRGEHQPGMCARCGAWCGALGLEPQPEDFVAHHRLRDCTIFERRAG
jgi:hypothetical protein